MLLGESFNELIAEAHEQLFEQSAKRAIIGAMIYGTWIDWNTSGAVPRIEYHFPHQIRMFTETDTQVEQAREFFAALEARYQNSLAEMFPLISGKAA